MQRLLTILLTIAVACGCISAALGQTADRNALKQGQSANKADAKARGKKQRPRTAATPEREAAAMTFALLHHPELANLLKALKKKQRRNQYNRAIRQLFQTSERLARLRDRAPERYALSLEAWKLDSRIRLLAARMTMNQDSQLDGQLAELVQARADVRLQELRIERDRLAKRLKRVDDLIEKYGSDPEAATRRELQRIKRSFVARERRRPKTKPTGQPVAAPTPTKAKSATVEKQTTKVN